MKQGQTFFGGAPGIRPHLWMILSDPEKSPRVVLANLSTADDGYTGLTVVQPGEHPFVTRPSFIRSDKVIVADVGMIEKAINEGLVSRRADLSSALLTKAQRALLASPFVPNEAKAILRAQGVSEPNRG